MPALLLVLLAWVLLAALCLGLGRLLLRALGPRAEGLEPLWTQAWFGWAALVVVGEALHLVVPLDGRVTLAFALAALVGIALDFKAILADVRGAVRAHPVAVIVLVVVAVLLADQALAAPRNPDTGVYFMQTVRWYQRFAVVPGLGNLQHRLAFNHAYFVWAALVDVGPLHGHGHHVANGLLLLGVAGPALAALERIVRTRAPLQVEDVVWAAMLAPMADQAFGHDLSSPAADLAVAAFGAVLAQLYVRRVARGAPTVPVFAFLAAAAVVCKPSLVCIAAPCVAAAALLSRARVRRWIVPSIGAGLVAIVPWIAHGIVLSGYPLFPSTFGNLHLRWRVPENIALTERRYLTLWGRGVKWTPDPHALDTPWVAHWFERAWLDNRHFLLPVVLLVLLALALAVRFRRLSPEDRAIAPWLLVPAIAAIALWWILSPDLRHLGALPWVLAGALAYLVLRTIPPQPIVHRTLAAVALLLALGAFVGEPLKWLDPKAFQPLPPQSTKTARLSSGDEIRLYGPDQECMDLPCALEVLPIRVRRPGDLSSGFESDAP